MTVIFKHYMLSSEDAGDLSAVREHTFDLISEAFESTEPAVIEAPPSSGKTTSAYQISLNTDTPVTYLCGRTDLYQEAKDYFNKKSDARPHFENTAETSDAETADSGTTYAVIPSPHRDCPSFQEGEPGNQEKIKHLYEKGYSGLQLHYLSADTARTPCGVDCRYVQKLKEIETAIESIDVLIGHHSHSHRDWYVKDRIVILDEFNADAFFESYPDSSTKSTDDPQKIIPQFLSSVPDDSDFPTNSFQDITDILVKRGSHEDTAAALEWFESQGVSRSEAENFDFLTHSFYKYDNTHLLAPFLTFSLFCMRDVGNGIELAPHPDDDPLKMWESVGVNPSTRVVRNRNTGRMDVFRPPDLSQAQQVIGLDGLPTIELWNLLLPPALEFTHKQVLEKPDFMTYLTEGLDMSIIQIGGGMHHYAGGRISSIDEDRFRIIKALEGKLFSLISSKKALEKYDEYDVLVKYFKPQEENIPEDRNFESLDFNRQYPLLMVRNFATVKSSNEFEKEDLGAVMGTPYPGDNVVKRWAGLCGEETNISGKGGDKTFGEFGDRIYHHLTHNQIVQAILRFGRDESVYNGAGATVYVSTFALPEWFSVNKKNQNSDR